MRVLSGRLRSLTGNSCGDGQHNDNVSLSSSSSPTVQLLCVHLSLSTRATKSRFVSPNDLLFALHTTAALRGVTEWRYFIMEIGKWLQRRVAVQRALLSTRCSKLGQFEYIRLASAVTPRPALYSVRLAACNWRWQCVTRDSWKTQIAKWQLLLLPPQKQFHPSSFIQHRYKCERPHANSN